MGPFTSYSMVLTIFLLVVAYIIVFLISPCSIFYIILAHESLGKWVGCAMFDSGFLDISNFKWVSLSVLDGLYESDKPYQLSCRVACSVTVVSETARRVSMSGIILITSSIIINTLC